MATSERARRARPSRHHGSRSNTGRVRPEIIPPATFAGTKPGYASKPLAADLHSVANMYGMWGHFGSECLDSLFSCCIKPPLRVTPFPHENADSFQTQSMGACIILLNWPCCDAHGSAPPNAAPRRYVRTPGTNTFQSTGSHRCCDCCPPQPDQHTAVLLGERQMTVDGKIYYWGPSWVGGE